MSMRGRISTLSQLKIKQRLSNLRFGKHSVKTASKIGKLQMFKFTMSLRFQGVYTVLTACWKRSDISKNAVQSPCKRHGRPRRLHNDPRARLRTSSCVVGELTATTLWRPDRALIRTPNHGVCFEHAQKCAPSFGVLYDPKASTGGVTAELLVIVLRAPRRSACFSDAVGSPREHSLLWCNSGIVSASAS